MIVDLPQLKRMAEGLNQRMLDAEHTLQKLERDISSVSKSDWDDVKREEFEKIINETKLKTVTAINSLKSYLEHLNMRIAELENK